MVLKAGGYWRARCPAEHLFLIAGHTMKTKRDALAEWDKTYGRGDQQPNAS